MKFLRLSVLRTSLLVVSSCLCLASGSLTAAQQTSILPVAIRYVDQVLDDGNLQVASSLIATDAVLETPEGSYVGPNGVAAFTDEMDDAFSRLDFEIDNAHFENEDMVIDFTMTGVQTGTYHGIRARCADVSVPGTAVLSLDDGVVDGHEISYDQALLVRTLVEFNQAAEWEGLDCDPARFAGDAPEVSRSGPESLCIKDDQCLTP